ncbi:hypothetical protein CTheo_6347 [Ceratobasidium theobromae]|uniref:Uncharacterized protein n=1 Tax=Ceratobasidium theobromae TaxID=1582974 RepID=A0A5N5QFH9_9AGAM|nr:hypothetical protein CTheo_6347 [Ceratobasidium theobromae]
MESEPTPKQHCHWYQDFVQTLKKAFRPCHSGSVSPPRAPSPPQTLSSQDSRPGTLPSALPPSVRAESPCIPSSPARASSSQGPDRPDPPSTRAPSLRSRPPSPERPPSLGLPNPEPPSPESHSPEPPNPEPLGPDRPLEAPQPEGYR